jgi:hypothetical protein
MAIQRAAARLSLGTLGFSLHRSLVAISKVITERCLSFCDFGSLGFAKSGDLFTCWRINRSKQNLTRLRAVGGDLRDLVETKPPSSVGPSVLCLFANTVVLDGDVSLPTRLKPHCVIEHDDCLFCECLRNAVVKLDC